LNKYDDNDDPNCVEDSEYNLAMHAAAALEMFSEKLGSIIL